MTAVLTRPSFWTEPRDPGTWQRALRRVAELGSVPDPWPAWEGPLRELLSRRAVAGLYGLKDSPKGPTCLGAGLLVAQGEGWDLHPDALPLVDARRDDFELGLARWLVERSPWVRLALRALASGAWSWPRGLAPLHAARAMRVGQDLAVGGPRVRDTLDAGASGVGQPVRVDLPARDLAPLHAPLYLLHALGWLSRDGNPALPADLGANLLPASPAELLRRFSREEADGRGFVALERVARRLWSAVHGRPAPPDVSAWADAVLVGAMAAGTIEVHAWAPGQPRHGRGLRGDRDRKLVRWTIHDDFDLPGGPP